MAGRASNNNSQTKRHDWADSSNLSGVLGLAPLPAQPDLAVPGSRLFDAGRVFDVCHVGLVLRAVLGVQLLLGLGLALAAPGFTQWTAWMSSGTVVTLTGVLLWLLLLCGLRHQLARWREPWQWAAVLSLGALCASLGWQLLTLASEEPSGGFRLVSVALAGGACAAMLLYWLKLRERAHRPADALARLVELQSRIRPHFLFNTLNTAMALVRVDPLRAEGVLEDLSELFRGALADADTVVSLDAEVELARRYLGIEQIRHGERLRVRWTLDPAAAAARVPPLLLQPLVENAVRHGVEPNETGGELEIATRAQGAEVEILVRNSVGAPSQQRGHGLALRNVRQRLSLMHDVAARFEVTTEPQQFTVRIVLPR
ncbi:sensor histidine kinase [Roseateles sp. DAIF2]|uniref:sensor histidine kinase n=1 Tax=Roseateles sp. DAIF2 TaxID=2714952 RepID=UPI0018A281B7|nr:histidine kinase [Roseateles sp. DAIF2]QPF74722.1 sensor histidine kinase [Roseateles sp. DAIF2]